MYSNYLLPHSLIQRRLIQAAKRAGKKNQSGSQNKDADGFGEDYLLSRLFVEPKQLQLCYNDKFKFTKDIVLGLRASLGYFIMIQTSDNIFVGALQSVDLEKGMVHISKVRAIKENAKQRQQSIDLASIKAVKGFINDPNYDEDANVDVYRFPSIQITPFDLKHVFRMVANVVYVTGSTSKFNYTLDEIRSQSAVGIVIEPNKVGHSAQANCIAIACINAVFIFDLAWIVTHINQFRTMINAPKPIKVMHSSKGIVELLRQRLDILPVEGIFDTMLANEKITLKKAECPLREFLIRYFKLPERFFLLDKGEQVGVFQKPLSTESCTYLAKLAALQLKLYQYMPPEKLPINFIELCKEYSTDLPKTVTA